MRAEGATLPSSLGAEIHEALGEYVYALEDPRTGAIFYVGRGRDDRVLQHARDALSGDEAGTKLDRIRDIARAGMQPRAWILRRRVGGRTTAAEMEALAIDVLSRWHSKLSNEVRGAGTEDGMVNIGRTWFEGIAGDDLWDAARKWWTCRPEDRPRPPSLLLAEAGNIIRGAWTVSLPPRRQEVTWAELDARRRAFIGSADAFQPFLACCFDGEPDNDWEALVGRHTRPPVLPRAYGSAFRYLNC